MLLLGLGRGMFLGCKFWSAWFLEGCLCGTVADVCALNRLDGLTPGRASGSAKRKAEFASPVGGKIGRGTNGDSPIGVKATKVSTGVVEGLQYVSLLDISCRMCWAP
jgi:hypothetical protein